MPEMTVSEVLFAAADEVDKGWCQRVPEDDAGNVCAVGSLDRVAPNPKIHCQCYFTLDEQLLQSGERCSIPFWNDKSTTTQQDVSTMMRKAALLAQERGE